jgi:hypothetical protein
MTGGSVRATLHGSHGVNGCHAVTFGNGVCASSVMSKVLSGSEVTAPLDDRRNVYAGDDSAVRPGRTTGSDGQHRNGWPAHEGDGLVERRAVR